MRYGDKYLSYNCQITHGFATQGWQLHGIGIFWYVFAAILDQELSTKGPFILCRISTNQENDLMKCQRSQFPRIPTLLSCSSLVHAHWYMCSFNNWAVTCDFQQCGIFTSVDSDEAVQPPFKLRNSKLCSFSSLILIEYSSD